MTGAEMIAAERQRQVEKEGWTAEHDAEHENEELLGAAICYAVNRAEVHQGRVITDRVGTGRTWFGPQYKLCRSAPPLWPWYEGDDKREKHGRIRSLAIAGALIAAEIDRLQRRPGALAEGAPCHLPSQPPGGFDPDTSR